MFSRTTNQTWVLLVTALALHGCGATSPSGEGENTGSGANATNSNGDGQNSNGDNGSDPGASNGDTSGGNGGSNGDSDACVGDCTPIEPGSVSFGETALSMAEPAGMAQLFDPLALQLITADLVKVFVAHFPDGLDEAGDAIAMGYGMGGRESTSDLFTFAKVGDTTVSLTSSGELTSQPFSMDFTMLLRDNGGANFANSTLEVKDVVYTAELSSDGKKLQNGKLSGYFTKADLMTLTIPLPAVACSQIDCGTCNSAGKYPKNAAQLIECHGVSPDPSRTDEYRVVLDVEESTLELASP